MVPFIYLSASKNIIYVYFIHFLIFFQETHEFDLHKLKTDLSEYNRMNGDVGLFLRRTHEHKEGL